MSEFTETQLAEAIRSVNDTVRSITREEIERRTLLAPDWDDIDLVIDLSAEPSQDSPSSPGRPGNRRVLAVAAGLVVIVGGAVALLRQSTSDEIEATDPTPTTLEDRSTSTDPATQAEPDNHKVAVEFARAFEALDLQAAEAMLADDPGIIQLSAAALGSPIEVDFTALEVFGGRSTFQGCRPDFEFATVFTCSFVIDDTLSRLHDIEPLELQTTIVIRDGSVESARIQSGAAYGAWLGEAWTPWIEWLAIDRPVEFATLFPNGASSSAADIMDPEIRRVFEQTLDEYADHQADEGRSGAGP